MRFPIFILCIIIFTQPSTCLGQATNSFVFGKISDKTDLSPIPYASIWFKSAKYEGAVSNSEGSFKLSIPSNFTSDSVFVSFLGYETVKIYLDQKSLKDSMQVLLPQQIFLLQDIEVLGTSPYTFLQQAALKTSQMSLSPAILNCYYREFISKNGSFTNFADGIVDYFVEKREGKPLFVQVRVNESRAKYVPVVIETKSMGSIDLPQQLDIDMLPYFLDPHRNLNNMVENENEYNFDLYEFADSVGNDFYKVVFTPKQEIKKPLVEGVFLIDKSSSLIHSVLYNVPNSHIEYFKIIKLLFGIRTQQNAATAYIQYEMVGDNIQLKYVKHSASVHVFDDKDYDVMHVFSNEILVNSFFTDAPKKFESSEVWRKKSIRKLGNNYKTNFWENKRSLLSTEEEDEIIQSLDAINPGN